METPSSANANPSSTGDPERFGCAVFALAAALYVLERCAAFAFLQSRAGSGGNAEARLLGFLFGQPPYSLPDILLGFDSYQGLFGLPVPQHFLPAILQGLHFLVNLWIVYLPFAFLRGCIRRSRQ